MKIRLIILLLLLMKITVPVVAQNDIAVRDSIIATIDAITDDEKRINHQIVQQQTYKQMSFARDLVDKLYADAIKVGSHIGELASITGSFDIANLSQDIPLMEAELKRLDELGEKYNLYKYYFRCQQRYLTKMASNGNIEWAVSESRKMKKKATDLKYTYGIVCSQLTMVQAYKFARNDAMMIQALEELLTYEGVTSNELFAIYSDLVMGSRNLKKMDDALKYLALERENLDNEIKRQPALKTYLDDRMLSNETRLADTHMDIGDYAKAKEHLKLADKYYKPTSFVSYYALYHSTYARYYAHTKEWELCFTAIDKAIDCLRDTQPLLLHTMMEKKVGYLERASRIGEALLLNRELLAVSDSLYTAFVQKQQQAIESNFRWESGLIKQARNSYILSLATIIFIIALLLVIVGFAVKFYLSHRQIKKATDESIAAENVVIEAQKLRTALLRNISTEMQEPLEQIEPDSQHGVESARGIEQQPEKLIKQLDLVVKYSALEVGSTEFNIQKSDIMGACHIAIKRVKESADNMVEIYFSSTIDSQLAHIDSQWMIECLTTAMMTPDESRSSYRINFDASYADNGEKLVIEITGSPLSDTAFSDRLQNIKNNINRLFIESCGGTYESQVSKLHPRLIISLPLDVIGC